LEIGLWFAPYLVMRNRFNGLGRILLAGTLLTAGAALGPGQDKSNPKPDNTKTNQADRQAGEPTADQQKNNKPDRETARRFASPFSRISRCPLMRIT